MADEKLTHRLTALWNMHLEHCTHIRHYEGQRATVATAIIAILGVLFALSTHDRVLDRADIPVLSLATGLSLFGALFSLKQRERLRLHARWANGFREEIDRQLAGSMIADIRQSIEARHVAKQRLFKWVRVGTLWPALYFLMTGVAVVCIGLALAH